MLPPNRKSLISNAAIMLALWGCAFVLRNWAWNGSYNDSPYATLALICFGAVSLIALGWSFRVMYIGYVVTVQRAHLKLHQWSMQNRQKRD
jgi:hypothetical protein